MWKCQALVYAPGCWRSDKGSVPQVSPGPAGCHRAAASASATSHGPGAVSLPQFPPEELGIPGSIPLPAPGWPQRQLSPALRGCHRCRACPCPRCRGFVQLKAGPERPLWSHGGFGAIPEPPSQCWDWEWLRSLWDCHTGCKGDQGSSPCHSQPPSSGLTGKHWGSSPLGRCHPLADKGAKDGAEQLPTSNLWVFLPCKTRQVSGLSSSEAEQPLSPRCRCGRAFCSPHVY